MFLSYAYVLLPSGFHFLSGICKTTHECDRTLECTLELEDTPEIPCKHLSFIHPHPQKRCAHLTPELIHDSTSPQSHYKWVRVTHVPAYTSAPMLPPGGLCTQGLLIPSRASICVHSHIENVGF